MSVGPHPQPWPKGEHFDPVLLENGDDRNVLDHYHYWKVDAIKRDLDTKRLGLEIAIENISHDFNMGTIVRTANAFNINKVHIIGRRQWNKRGAMVTDTYMNIEYHASVTAFEQAIRADERQIIAVDIVDGAKRLSDVQLPEKAVLVFGSERDGLSEALRARADITVMIEQSGSTRSVNVGVAAGIAMYAWLQQHALTR
jgi:tRNA G18 (ribose-2'-O)-methylase SpoU